MKRFVSIPILLMALLVLAACNNGGPSSADNPKGNGNPPSSQSNPTADFARCMREHGQNVPDPDPNQEDYSITPPGGAPSPQWNAAQQACRQYLPNGGAPQAPDQQELDALRAHVACMREHGIELTDPDPNTGQSRFAGRLA